MPDGLYERDALAWAEHQAGLLRRLAAGERLNENVDWAHVIEEVQDVGLSELRACQSLLAQAFLHLMKLHAWPDDPAVQHWRAEVAAFLAGARRNFTPSMRQRIDLDALFQDAREQIGLLAGDVPLALPRQCPFELQELVEKRPEIRALVLRMARAGEG